MSEGVNRIFSPHVPRKKRAWGVSFEEIANYLLTISTKRDIIFSVDGALAQLVARLNGIQKVRGSTPLCSTIKNEHPGAGAHFLC